MGKEIGKDLMRKIMCAQCRWLVKDGHAMAMKFLGGPNLGSPDAVDSVVSTLVDYMMDIANPILAAAGLEKNGKTQSVLETSSRVLLGSIEQNVNKYHLNKEQASEFSQAWKRLQAMRALAVSKARKRRQGSTTNNKHFQVCFYSYFHIR